MGSDRDRTLATVSRREQQTLAPAVAAPLVPLAPLAGGTHAAAVAARDRALRRLLFYTLETAVAVAGDGDAAGIHEEETEDGLVGHILISRPAVAVVDADLAEGSGLSACERIKRDPLTRSTALIVVSGRYDRADLDAAVMAGADAFVTKPFSPLRLRALALQLGAEAAAADAEHADQRGARRRARVGRGPAHLRYPERFDLPPALAAGSAREGKQAG